MRSKSHHHQCRINHGAGGAPAPGPLSSGGLIISVTLLQSLSEFVGMLRERKKFEEFVEMGKELSGASEFSEKRTKYSRRTADDQTVQGVTMSHCEEFRISTFLVMIDFLLLDLDKRIKNYSKVDERFSFLRHTYVEADVSLAGVVDFYCKDLEVAMPVERSETACHAPVVPDTCALHLASL